VISPAVPVAVRILHREPGPGAGPLERWLAAERARLAATQAGRFEAAGAADVAVVAGPPDDTPFGARLRALAAAAEGGLVVLGSGALALAAPADLRRFVAAAASPAEVALANNRHSADAVALGRGAVRTLGRLPDLEADNALPRWLEEVAGVAVDDLRSRWRLGVDLDSPLDVLLVGRHRVASRDGIGAVRADLPDVPDLGRVGDRLAAVAAVAADRRAELLVAGRTSSRTVAWLERGVAARTRVLVEERGLRASRLAVGAGAGPGAPARPPASVLGALLDRDGPGSLGTVVAGLAEAAAIDTRVLLAHRFGADEATWPPAEDRFASDLLLHERIADPWLRALTRAAADGPIPILLGGHTLVGPGLRLALAARRPDARAR
jgi:hypothetical protein